MSEVSSQEKVNSTADAAELKNKLSNVTNSITNNNIGTPTITNSNQILKRENIKQEGTLSKPLKINKKKKNHKKKKNQCSLLDCNNTASRFIGDCDFCKGHFCVNHRLMEYHKCKEMQSCKDQVHKRNADKLAAEQTKTPKIQI